MSTSILSSLASSALLKLFACSVTMWDGPVCHEESNPYSFAGDSVAQIVAYGCNTPDVACWWLAFERHDISSSLSTRHFCLLSYS